MNKTKQTTITNQFLTKTITKIRIQKTAKTIGQKHGNIQPQKHKHIIYKKKKLKHTTTKNNYQMDNKRTTRKHNDNK